MSFGDKEKELVSALFENLKKQFPNMPSIKGMNVNVITKRLDSYNNDSYLHRDRLLTSKADEETRQSIIESDKYIEPIVNNYTTLYSDIFEMFQDDIVDLDADNEKKFQTEYELFMRQIFESVYRPDLPYFSEDVEYGLMTKDGVSGTIQKFPYEESEYTYKSIKNTMMANNTYNDDGFIQSLKSAKPQEDKDAIYQKSVTIKDVSKLSDNYLAAKEHYNSKFFLVRWFSFGERAAINDAKKTLEQYQTRCKEDKISFDEFVKKAATVTPEAEEKRKQLKENGKKLTNEIRQIKKDVNNKYYLIEEEKALKAEEKAKEEAEIAELEAKDPLKIKEKQLKDLTAKYLKTKCKDPVIQQQIRKVKEEIAKIQEERKIEEKEIGNREKEEEREKEDKKNKLEEKKEAPKKMTEEEIEAFSEKLDTLDFSQFEQKESNKEKEKVEPTKEELLAKEVKRADNQIGQLAYLDLKAVKENPNANSKDAQMYKDLVDRKDETPDRTFMDNKYQEYSKKFEGVSLGKHKGYSYTQEQCEKINSYFESRCKLAGLGEATGPEKTENVVKKVDEQVINKGAIGIDVNKK